MTIRGNNKVNRREILGATAALGMNGFAISDAIATAAPHAWTKLDTVPYRGKQDDIYFINKDIGWYGNGAGKLYQTTNGGLNWNLKHEQAGTFIRALGFANENVGFIGNIGTDYYPNVSDTNPLYRTEDGGANWATVTTPNIGVVKGICGIHILKRRTVYQGILIDQPIIHAAGRVGGPAALMRSIDGGRNWAISDLSQYAAMIFDVYFMDANIGFLCSSTDSDIEKGNAQILRTINGGRTWSVVYRSTRPFENCWKMNFPTNLIGYATIQSYDENNVQQRIIKTTNGGRSWRELNLVNNKDARQFGIGFASPDLGWVGTRIGGFETIDGGRSWRPNNLGPAVNKVRVIRDTNHTCAFAIGVDVWRLDL